MTSTVPAIILGSQKILIEEVLGKVEGIVGMFIDVVQCALHRNALSRADNSEFNVTPNTYCEGRMIICIERGFVIFRKKK
jgi:hypothetical protein